VDEDLIVISLYVDDLLITGSNDGLIKNLMNELKKDFEMTDLGMMKYFLGMEVDQSDKGIFVCQQRYAREILKKFHMENCKPVNTPLVQNLKLLMDDGATKIDGKVYRSLIGCLLYLSATRPDIM
jgi:hypothetical protein